MRTSLTRVLMLVAAAVLLTACSASVSAGTSDPSLSRSDVEDQVSAELVDGGGPEDGAATDVDGSDIGFDYSVAALLPVALVEQQVSDGLAEQVGQTPDGVSCPDDLEATVGASTTCLITAGEDTLDAEATVSAIDGDTVNFDIEVADAVN